MSQTKAQLISDLVQALNFTGTANAPANGLFLSASNQLKLATASTERLKIDGTEVVVNDTGASVDFRIEGDTDTNLFIVDASTDKIGIGAAPITTGSKLEISRSLTDAFVDASDTILRLINTNTSANTNQTSLEFTTFTTGVGADSAIVSQAEDASGNSRLEFWTDTSNGMTEKMSIASNGTVTVAGDITSTGRVTAADLTIQRSSGNLSALFVADSGLGTLEIGGSTGAFIDLKRPNSDDFDLRIETQGTGGVITSASGLTLATAAGSSVVVNRNLDVNDGIDVTGNLNVIGGITASSTGNASLILDAGTGSQAGDQLSFIDFKLDGTLKANIAVNEATSGNPLEINSAGTGATKLFNAGSEKLSTSGSGVSVTGSVAVTGTTDGVLNLDTSDSRGAFVRFGQGGSFHNMVGCADGLITSLDKEDLGIRATDRIGFATNGDNLKMTILSSGNVGIGTITPSTIFHIKTFNPDVYLENTGTGTGQLRIGHFTNGAFIGTYSDDGGGSDALRLGIHSGDEKMRIHTNGFVGIGTINPDQELHVKGVGTVATFEGSGGGGFIAIKDQDDGTVAFIGTDAGKLKFQTSSNSYSDKLVIDTSGKLSTGGENSPDVSAGGLCLNQGSESTNILTFKSSDIAHGVTTFDETDTYFSARKSSSNKGGLRLHAFTDQAGSDPAFEFHGIIASDADGGYVPFEFRGHEANGTGTQNIAANRRIAKFTNSDGSIISSITGTGITFGNDTSAENALDDYEEGSFTPTSNATLTTAAGFYTKIGRQVTLHMRITVGSSSGNGVFNITGLPFQAGMDGTTSNGAVPSGFGYISSGSVIPQIHHIHNDTKIQFYNFNNFMSLGNVSGKEYRFGLVYYTA